MISLHAVGIVSPTDEFILSNMICSKNDLRITTHPSAGTRISVRNMSLAPREGAQRYRWAYFMMKANSDCEAEELSRFATEIDAQRFIDENWDDFVENRVAYLAMQTV